MNERADMAKAVCAELLNTVDQGEAVEVLLTALGTMISLGDHKRARLIQMHMLADHMQAEFAMTGDL